jgi:hypothetical protein
MVRAGEARRERELDTRAGSAWRALALLSACVALVNGCAIDPRKLTVSEGATPRDAGFGMDGGANEGGPNEGGAAGAAGSQHAVAGSDGPPRAGRDAEAGTVVDAEAGTETGPDTDTSEGDCCALPAADGGCADVDEACAPAGAARMDQVRAMTRVLTRAPAFAECLQHTMHEASDNLVTAADAVPGVGCSDQTPRYERNGYGRYVSCMPEPDPEHGGQVIEGTSHGDPAWNELVDRQLSRALNALQVEIELFPVASASAGVRHAGYDATTGVSHVSYPGPARELSFEQAVGPYHDGSGLLPDVVRASLRNLGYDDGCHPDQQPAGADHGNCGRDRERWHPDRALTNIAAFCAKEILLRSANPVNPSCGTQGSGAQQGLRSCAQRGLMLIASYADMSGVACHCVPDPLAFGANTNGDRFGAALAVGDFDGDLRQDLAVGAPNKQFPGGTGRGGVFLYRGSALGLQPWRSLSSSEIGFPQDDASCGAALAAGDFDGNGGSDLVVGCPGLDSASGGVAIIPGCRAPCASGEGGLQIAMRQHLSASLPGEFGLALAVGRYAEDDALDDLVVGAPSASGVVASAGRVEIYRGVADDGMLEPAGAYQGDEPHARFGAALAIGDVQSAEGNELLIGAPGPLGGDTAAGGSVYVVSESGTTRLEPPTSGAGDGFGSAIAAGELDGDELAEIVIAAPGSACLYRARGASAHPQPPELVKSYSTAGPATTVAVIPPLDDGVQRLVLAGQPGADTVTLYRPSGTLFAVEEQLGQREQPFWSAEHDARDGGHCSQRGALEQDVACAIDAATFGDTSVGSALAFGNFGAGQQLVLGAPGERAVQPAGVEAGAVYVRGGSRAFDAAHQLHVDPLEYRIDQASTFYAGAGDAWRFGAPSKWHDYVCEAGETCLTWRGPGATGVVAFSRDVAGKVGHAWVGASTKTRFDVAWLWHESLCSGRQLCAVGDVDADGSDDLIAFVRDEISEHANHVHVLRCRGCPLEEWHDDFCRIGNLCLVGRLGSPVGDRDGDDLVEIEPGGAVRFAFADAVGGRFVPSEEEPGGTLCGDGHQCLLADVDGDGLADVVEFQQGERGEVRVARRSGSGFAPAQRWHPSFCTAGEECRAGDVNGDGFADIVSFVREATSGKEGEVWVSLSNGVDFGRAERWARNLCRRTQTCQLGDANGDRRSDVVVFIGPTDGEDSHDVEVALSLPTPLP